MATCYTDTGRHRRAQTSRQTDTQTDAHTHVHLNCVQSGTQFLINLMLTSKVYRLFLRLVALFTPPVVKVTWFIESQG